MDDQDMRDQSTVNQNSRIISCFSKEVLFYTQIWILNTYKTKLPSDVSMYHHLLLLLESDSIAYSDPLSSSSI